MKDPLTPLEARVLGCLLEKQVTTPEQYPLSLNALVSACNQRSNRDPSMSLADAEVQGIVDGLVRKSLVMEKSGFGSRVPKYQPRFCNLEFSALQFTAQELAIVCELLLRGPQTAGELRTRAARMAEFREVGEVEAALLALAARQPHALVVRLPREAGHRDARWTQLFTGPVAAGAEAVQRTATIAASAPAMVARAQPAQESPERERLERLEEEVRQLRELVQDLRQRLGVGDGN